MVYFCKKIWHYALSKIAKSGHTVVILCLLVLICIIFKCFWAVVVVNWSACLPNTLTIRVRVPLKPTVFLKKLCLKIEEINKKRPWLAHLKKCFMLKVWKVCNRLSDVAWRNLRKGHRGGEKWNARNINSFFWNLSLWNHISRRQQQTTTCCSKL